MISEPLIGTAHRLLQVGTGPYATLVLAESEGDMWLAYVRFDEPPQPGLRFHFRGTVWEVIWTERAGCGARPVVM